MGLFGKKSSKGDKGNDKHAVSNAANDKSQVGAVYVQGMNDGTLPSPSAPTLRDEDLPVATPVDAECVAVAPSMKASAAKTTTTTVRLEPFVQSSNAYNETFGFPNDQRFGRHPCLLQPCPNCGLESRTKVRTFPNIITWGLSLLLLLLFWPLCWIPLVVEKMKQTDHYCALCQQKVGSVQPCSDCFVKRRH